MRWGFVGPGGLRGVPFGVPETLEKKKTEGGGGGVRGVATVQGILVFEWKESHELWDGWDEKESKSS